jgi:succinate dehydrogenase / fumarate reductase, cytochrome b subunit
MKRPLSPHLTIYKPQISSVLSITHRASGIFLFFGALILSWLIVGLVFYPKISECSFFNGLFIKVLLFLWTLALFFHFLNGIRHLFWDVGYGFKIKTMNASGILVLVLTLVLASGFWILISR